MLKLDTLFNTIGALFFLIISLLAQIHPPTETEKQHRPGNLVVSINWPTGPDDVDLWMSAPGDKRVGYLSKQGTVVALLRDDLGATNDLTDANFESAYTRGIPDGDYGVNVHCYTCRGPVLVQVEIGIVGAHKLWVGSVEVGPKQERTALRWKMKDGRMVAGSNSQVFKAIRGGVMTPQDMANACRNALSVQPRFGTEENKAVVTMVTPKGFRRPKGFPRGYLLQVTRDGDSVWHFNAKGLLRWLEVNGLVSP